MSNELHQKKKTNGQKIRPVDTVVQTSKINSISLQLITAATQKNCDLSSYSTSIHCTYLFQSNGSSRVVILGSPTHE